MRLYSHQQKIVDKDPTKHLLAWQTGTGKTIAAIRLCENPCKSVLVVCPKSLKQQWQSEVAKFAREKHLFQVYTKEEFRKKAPQMGRAPYIIIDEAHYFSGMKSQMRKRMEVYIKKYKPERVYLLTATPYMSTPFNIYCLGRLLGKDWGYMKFKSFFFHEVKMGHRWIPVVKPKMEKFVASLVNKLGSTVRMDECVDVPKQTFLTEHFELTREQKRAIKEIEDTLPIVRWTKVHQICGGSLKGDEYNEPQYFKSEKLNRAIDLAKEHKKIIFVCRYNCEVEMLTTAIGEKTDKLVYKITGKTDDKPEIIASAEMNDEVVVIINAACSEGYELPSFPIMVFYSYDFSLKNYVQILGRIQRINRIKKNVYLSLTVPGTIDEDVYNCIKKKENFDIEIYDRGTISN